LKIFNLDCHVSVIADLKQIFEKFGHEVTSWSISGHNWVFNRRPKQVEIVNQNTWMSLNDEMCDKFYERYKDELSQYDAFLCTYPITFSMLYDKFNKPIILHIPIRYEVPFQNDKIKWERFNEYLRKRIDKGIIIPVANSEYDKEYFEFFVGRECQLIPSICNYTGSNWNPTNDKFLYSSRLKLPLNTDLIVDKDSLGKYKWQDLAAYKGLIVVPYTCSTMSIFEHYNANIPLFFPSKAFMMELYKSHGDSVLSEISWNRIFSLPPNSIIDCDFDKDPNRYDNAEIMSEWISLSDFYNQEWMPHIVYFDSLQDLSNKLSTTNLFEVSNKMKKFNIRMTEIIYTLWINILNEVDESFKNR
jgi:hypothetical protein